MHKITTHNRIAAKKLLHSKWTAVNPINKEKHFVIIAVEFDDNNTVIHCEIEAVMTKRVMNIDWLELKNTTKWRSGWQ